MTGASWCRMRRNATSQRDALLSLAVATKYVMAVDLGTGGPKVALVSVEGEVVGYEWEATKLNLFPGGGAEQDPDDWWRAIKTAWERLRARIDCAAEDVVAVSCTAQWSGTVAVDEQGRHLHDALIWMDSRGAPHVDVLTDGVIKVSGYAITKILRWIRMTGGGPTKSGKDSIAHILWLKNERPDIYERTHKFLEPTNYLNMRFCGRMAASFDSIILHWVTDNRNIDRIEYDAGLLALAGIERDKLPELKPATEVLGTVTPAVAEEFGISSDAKVMMGTPDMQSAAVGSGAVRDYEPHIYIGTSSWLTCHLPFKKTDIAHNMASLPSPIPGRYFLACEQETAGECLDFVLDKMMFADDVLSVGPRPEDVFARVNELAAQAPPGSDGLIFTPWLYGERSPIDDHSVRGGFFNLSLSATRAHLLRAVMEGVAYNSRWLLRYAEAFAKRRFDTIRVIGGGAKSDLWCRILADVLGRPMQQVKDPILANVRGVATLALVGLGYSDFDAVAERVAIKQTLEPRAEHRQVYDDLFREFLQIYKQNRRTYARLNG